jgi:hypothetical protein
MSSNDEEEEVVFCEFISRPEGKPILKLILVIIVIIILFFVIILISANTDVIWLVVKIICLIIFYVSIIYVIIWYKKRKVLQGEGVVCEEEGQQIIISLARSEKPKTVKTLVVPATIAKTKGAEKKTKKKAERIKEEKKITTSLEAEIGEYDVNFFRSDAICYALSAIGIFCCLDAFTNKIEQLTGGSIDEKFKNTEQIFQFFERKESKIPDKYETSWNLLGNRTNFDLSLNLMFFTIKELYYYGDESYRNSAEQAFKSVTGKDCFENIKDVLLNSMKILKERSNNVDKKIKDVMKFFPTFVQLFTEGKIDCGNINDGLYLLTSFLLNTYSIHEISNIFTFSEGNNEPEILFDVSIQTQEDLKTKNIDKFLEGGSFEKLYEKHKGYLVDDAKKSVRKGYYHLFSFAIFSSGTLKAKQQEIEKVYKQKLEGLYKKL